MRELQSSIPPQGRAEIRPPANRLRKPQDPVLANRDPELIGRLLPVFSLIGDLYFRSVIEGAENYTSGPALYVGTHNGATALPDTFVFATELWRRFGPEVPSYALMHDILRWLPGFASVIPKLGGLPADSRSALVALRAGHPLLVLPGGELDALKPFSRRNEIVFGPRRGFIRLALAGQVPIVPIVSAGAHETLLILNDGRRLAELLGLRRLLRVETLPLSLGFPFGLGLAGIGALPLPAQITVRLLPKIELGEPPEAASDPVVVERLFERVRATMQRALDELSAGRKVFFGR
jgi:1-acyl-sn-glycerol-3-phosphate acyltransferase